MTYFKDGIETQILRTSLGTSFGKDSSIRHYCKTKFVKSKAKVTGVKSPTKETHSNDNLMEEGKDKNGENLLVIMARLFRLLERRSSSVQS